MSDVKDKGSKKGDANVLDMTPKRTRKWKRGEKVTILVPRARSVLGRHFIDALGMKSVYTVNLDEYGSAVWKLCDGKRTVREIGKELRKGFGEKVEPLYDRLSVFISIMNREELIRFV